MKRVLTFSILTFFYANVLFGQSRLLEKISEIPPSNKKLDIPKYPNGKPFVYWHFSKQKQTYLKLVQPEQSSDSLIFRVWATEPTRKKNQRHDLVEIKYLKNNWTGQVINMNVDLKKSKLEEIITSYSVTQVKPISTWKNVIDSLYFYKIDSLPTDEYLPDYANKSTAYANRAPTFSFEYSTTKEYRFYQYNNVWQIEDSYWQAKNVVRIINLLDREFRVDSLANDFYLKKIKK